jgi:dipeptidyl aminopeptidase/acylaminoacyl peptidase
MKTAGRPCKLVGFPGQNHGFFNREPNRSKTLAETDRFFEKLGWIGEGKRMD